MLLCQEVEIQGTADTDLPLDKPLGVSSIPRTINIYFVLGLALSANVCKKITGRLTSAIAKQEDVSVQLEALDILSDMLSR